MVPGRDTCTSTCAATANSAAPALGRFVEQVAADVLESGNAKALEPMSASDRKAVHDKVNEIDGVHTTSEGVDPRRWVKIVPDEG